MTATTTLDTTCQICQLTIDDMNDDVIYVLWNGRAECLSKPNHKVCAEARYIENRKRAEGAEECQQCGIVDFTVFDGYCRQCSNLVDEFQGEIANLF